MKQSDVSAAMRPAAAFALANGLTCSQALRGFLLTLADLALEQTKVDGHRHQNEAARLLKISAGYMSRIVAGKVTPGAAGQRVNSGRPTKFSDDNPPAKVIGELEL